MKPVTRLPISQFCLCLAIPILTLTAISYADRVDDLLDTAHSDVSLVDDNAIKAWNGVVDAFRRNDLAKAEELGEAFLKAEHKTSPYQVLGVRVMMDLANAASPTVTHDAELAVDAKRLLLEREQLRAKFAALQATIQNANATINKLTNNRKQPVQMGTAAYLKCLQADREIARANAEIEAMEPKIEANKVEVGKLEVAADSKLKKDAMKLLDMLMEAGEVEAAFAVTNVFTRVVGSDLDIAKKQQDVIRLQEETNKAAKLVAAITEEIEPLLALGQGRAAQAKLDELMAKVDVSTQTASVKKLTTMKIKPLGMRITAARRAESGGHPVDPGEVAEVSARLGQLERKLETAQASFATLIRSIDGFAEFSGDYAAASDFEKVVARLGEKVRSGVISKQKLDNMIRAKAEHAGILSEVELLQTEAESLTVVQKARLAGLRSTAQSALDLLRQTTQ